jgi:SAUR family protein
MGRGMGNKMSQIVALKKLVRKLQGLVNVSRILRCVICPPTRRRSYGCFSYECDHGNGVDLPRDVPQGHFAVYVGNERSRFIVPTAYLSHPLFKTLLEKAEEEYGFDHQMGLTIPCEEIAFQYITSVLEREDLIAFLIPVIYIYI